MQYSVSFHTSLTSAEKKEIEELRTKDPIFFNFFFSDWSSKLFEHEKDQGGVVLCRAYDVSKKRESIAGFLIYECDSDYLYSKEAGKNPNNEIGALISFLYVAPAYRHLQFVAERMIFELEKRCNDIWARTYDNDKIFFSALFYMNYTFQKSWENISETPSGTKIEQWHKSIDHLHVAEEIGPELQKVKCMYHHADDICVMMQFKHCQHQGGFFTSNIDDACKCAYCSSIDDKYSAKNKEKEYHCARCGFGTGLFIKICPICKSTDMWKDKDGHSYNPSREFSNLRHRHFYDE